MRTARPARRLQAASDRRPPATTCRGRRAAERFRNLTAAIIDCPAFCGAHERVCAAHAPVNNGINGDSVKGALVLHAWLQLNDPILRRWETIATVRVPESRLPRFAAEAE